MFSKVMIKINYANMLRNFNTYQNYTQQFQIGRNKLLYFQPFVFYQQHYCKHYQLLHFF